MEIIHYPHPTLRHKAKPLKKVDAELKQMIAQMFELMYEHEGIGLAATQVDLPYRVFVLNITGNREQTDEEHVFINPVISHRKGHVEDTEGCLSLPKVYAPVRRAANIVVSAFDLSGKQVTLEASELFARAIQHEIDHLDGVMFIDRLTPSQELKIKEQVREFEDRFQRLRQAGAIPSDEAIAERLKELEAKRT